MQSNPTVLVLGSASPRRRALLEQAGVAVESCPAEVDESVAPNELPEAYLERVVAAKLAAVQARVGQKRLVLVADTSVLLGDVILGKPRDPAHATAMLRSLLGRHHRVVTRFALARGARVESASVVTEVAMRSAADAEIDAYVATGEGVDKAGAYAIQGGGARFVRGIVGSYTSVVGLPLCEVLEALERFALPLG